ncbi:MAG: hypothetical protein ACYDAM_05045 [Leptospirales bacterium]
MKTQKGRIAIALISAGGSVLVIGFLTVPRTLVASESGIMLALGFWLLKISFSKQEKEKRYWIQLGFIGLFLTALTGILLGVTLARPTVDPIPFQGIELHLFAGLAFTLSTLRMIFPYYPQNTSPGIRPAFLYNLGIVALFSLPLLGQKWHPAFIALTLLFAGLSGIRTPFYGKIPLLMLGSAITLLAAQTWTSIAAPIFPFFLVAWLYSLCSPIFPKGASRIAANIGFLAILAGLWSNNPPLVGIGIGLHVFAVGVLIFQFFKNYSSNPDLREQTTN